MVSSNMDLLVVGGGPSGMMAALAAAERGRRVVLCEQLTTPGRKLLASGGGRCNLTNTLDVAELCRAFGRQERFVRATLQELDTGWLRTYLEGVGVATHAPDGRRVFPVSHRAVDVLEPLRRRMEALEVEILGSCEVSAIRVEEGAVVGLTTSRKRLEASRVVLASGGRSYPELGATGTGLEMAAAVGHRVNGTFPAMVPLLTRESWPARCTAHTLPAVNVTIDLPGARGLSRCGDLIFTWRGLAGPVILDLSREVAPLLRRGPVPLLIELAGGRGQEGWRHELRRVRAERTAARLVTALVELGLPGPLAEVLLELAGIPTTRLVGELSKREQSELARLLHRFPVTVVATEGFDRAMVTRGGGRSATGGSTVPREQAGQGPLLLRRGARRRRPVRRVQPAVGLCQRPSRRQLCCAVATTRTRTPPCRGRRHGRRSRLRLPRPR